MGKFNLRSALEKNGATLDENQIKFVSAFETALDERAKNQVQKRKTKMVTRLLLLLKFVTLQRRWKRWRKNRLEVCQTLKNSN